MRLAFRLYRGLLALGLAALGFMLATLAIQRPLEMSESSGLLLAVAAAALVFAAVALFQTRIASLTLVAVAAIALPWAVAMAPWPVALLTGVAAIELYALIGLKPWRPDPAPPLAEDRRDD